MRYYESSQTFHYNWEQVVKAFWCRYPNPFSAHVLSEDVVHRKIDSDGNLLTKRLISKTNSMPKWIERFMSSKFVYIIEESIIDPKRKILTTYTRNIGLKHLMTVEEKVTYRSSEEDSEWTVAERSAWIDSSVFGLSSAAQKFGLDRFRKNVVKTCQGFNFVLNQLYGNLNAELTANADNQLSINPLLKEKLREKAMKASELAAAAKSKARVPVVVASNQTDAE